MLRPRPALTIILLLAALLLAAALRLAIGKDPATHTLSFDFTHLDLRVPRLLAGCIVGVCLAVAGVMLQSLLRNPLASPDILGLASGAGLGVMIAAYLGYLAGLGIASTDALGLGTGTAALAGALGGLALVYTLSQRRGLLDPVTLILIGVVISMIASAGTMLVRHLLPDQGIAAGRALLGSIRDPSGRELVITGLVAAVGVLAGVVCSRAMDAAALGEDEARSVGVRLGRLRAVLFIASGVLTAASFALAGPVGFVGLICPHVVRLLAGPSHRVLVLGSSLAGAALVVLCDAAVRAIDLGSGQLPIGVLTSLIGGPVLIGLLRRSRAA